MHSCQKKQREEKVARDMRQIYLSIYLSHLIGFEVVTPEPGHPSQRLGAGFPVQLRDAQLREVVAAPRLGGGDKKRRHRYRREKGGKKKAVVYYALFVQYITILDSV